MITNTELARAEYTLRLTAERALGVKTKHASRALIRSVIEIAEDVLPIVAEFEGIDDPYMLAREALSHPAKSNNMERVAYALRFVDFLEQQTTSGGPDS